MNKLIFVTFNSLSTDGGGTIRIKSLFKYSRSTRNSVLFSNNPGSDESCGEYFLGVTFSATEKRFFQLLITFLPCSVVKLFFYKKLNYLELFFKEKIMPLNGDIVFCEYLDNSIGSYLRRRGVLVRYTNDLHGIATNEFLNKKTGFGIWNKFKYHVARIHDRKILSMADSHIFASESMMSFFNDNYPKFRSKKYFYIPYLLDSAALDVQIDTSFQKDIVDRYALDRFSSIVFYAGAYKEIGGVSDLVEAFALVLKNNPEVGLVLVGGGPCQNLVDSKIEGLGLGEKVIQLGFQPYDKLFSLQSLSDVIVCPDRENLYSNLIVHLKYFDSVASNKPVVCGSFSAVNEININNQLSIPYKPSDLPCMADTINKVLAGDLIDVSSIKGNRALIKNKFTYNSYAEIICSIEA